VTEPAVERYLEDRFATLAETESGLHATSAHDGAATLVSALSDLELLASDEKDRWLARLERASEDPLDRPLAPADLRRKASEYIERAFANVAAEEHGAASAEWRLYGALTAFVDVGLLTGRDFELWRGRLWNRDEEPNTADAGPHSAQTHLLMTVPGPEGGISGLRVTVVEFYADGVSLQWHLAPGRRGRPFLSMRGSRQRSPFPEDPLVHLADDAGTTYVWQGGGSAHGSQRKAGVLGHTDFAPAVPKQASGLRISSGDEAVEVSLS
jgi:hypothetical protein